MILHEKEKVNHPFKLRSHVSDRDIHSQRYRKTTQRVFIYVAPHI